MTPPDISRALAMVQLAVFEAVNAVDRNYEPYSGSYLPVAGPVSKDLAAAQAAYAMLSVLFPEGQSSYVSRLAADQAAVSDATVRTRSTDLGNAAAQLITQLRVADGANAGNSYQPQAPVTAGAWQPTSNVLWGTPNGGAVHPEWGFVRPFALATGDQFLPPPPPLLNSAAYASAYYEVQTLGRATGTRRTAEQQKIPYFWADGPGKVTCYIDGMNVPPGKAVAPIRCAR